MTVQPVCYVPVLKTKRGEKQALARLAPHVRDRIVPLFEIVEDKKGKSLSAHLATCLADLAAAADGMTVLLDPREISGPRGAAETAFESARRDFGISFAAVVSPTVPRSVLDAARRSAARVAVRTTRKLLESGQHAEAIEAFLRIAETNPAQVDLLLDMGSIDDMIPTGGRRLATAFLDATPQLTTWRSVTILGTAFPLGLTSFDRDAATLVPRTEWGVWRDCFWLKRETIPRVPWFGDCAIQHPRGVEGFDPRTMQGSAAIRYAIADDWLIVKGRGTKSVRPKLQFPQLARRLTSDHRYFGTTHCPACSDIASAADGAPRLAGLTKWREIGTLHHITLVVDQLEALGAL